MRNEQKIIFI